MIYTQIYLFTIFLLNGLIIGLLFDFFRILRKAIKTPDFMTYIEDTLFWILTGFLILYSIFTYNDGQIRLFMFFAITIGFVLYCICISRFILKITLTSINFVKKIFHTILSIVKVPFRILITAFKKVFFNPISFIIINIRNFFTKIFKNFCNILKKSKLSTKFVKNAKN